MKRIFAITLAALMLAAALASCAGAKTAATAISPKITLTSSDAETAAAWLTDRLGEVPDNVVIGTDAGAYGVDVAALEKDGYFIRNFGGEVALLARTADGLDRAVRVYAKAVEAGSEVADVTYHEGARIKALTIAGRDVAEYTIYCEDDANMLAGANELSARIAEANGAELAVAAGEPAAPYIALKYVHDESLNSCGYRWSVTDDGLTIECSDGYKPSSAFYAVTRFLVNRLDWFGLDNGFEDLPPADLIEIAAGESGGETNDFDNPDLFYGDGIITWDRFENKNVSNRPMTSLHVCCHGLQNNRFAAELSTSSSPWAFDQPCYLDEDFLESSIEDVRNYIEKRGKAQATGDGAPFYVDIAAGDNDGWCGCKKCSKLYNHEGGTQAAAVITWANQLSETLAEEYPNVVYGIFAYAGSNKPPKTVRPNEYLHVTFCYDGCCSAHGLNAADCEEIIPKTSGVGSDRSNVQMEAYLRRWCEISNNVYVWFYGLGNGMLSLSFAHTIREDMRFFHEIGIRGMFWNNDDFGFTDGMVSMWLGASMIWNADMSDEELEAVYDRILRVMYGDAASYVKDYITAMDNMQRSGTCATCWAWGKAVSPQLLAVSEMWKTRYDELFELTQGAIAFADSAIQQRRLEFISCGCIYTGSMSSYFAAYNAYDDERVGELCRRYALIDGYTSKYGYDMTRYIPGLGIDGYARDLVSQAWGTYRSVHGSYLTWYPDKPTRPAPERFS